MKLWKSVSALLALCYLLCSGAHAQAPRPAVLGLLATVADTSLLRPAQVGQPFPYGRGVNMELSLYRRVRRLGLVADTLLASKNRRIDSLTAQLLTADRRYANCHQALGESLTANERQAATIAGISASYQKMEKQERRGHLNIFTPAGLLAFVSGTLLGGFIASHL